MAANKVLLVDDDPGIIEVLKLYFEKEGYQVSTCMQGDKAVAAFNSFAPDIVILDLMLPGMDGNDICREIRKTSDCPIIMLTARTDTLDKIVGLELGADDYIPKPFEPKEVLARVKAVLRRTDKRDAAPAPSEKSEGSADVITYPGFSVDKIRYVVSVDGKEIYMPMISTENHVQSTSISSVSERRSRIPTGSRTGALRPSGARVINSRRGK